MTQFTKNTLLTLSKEQLVFLIDLFYSSQFLVGEVLVDASKQHISPERALDKIREYMMGAPSINQPAERLSAWIDLAMEKITADEYMRILGLVDEENV